MVWLCSAARKKIVFGAVSCFLLDVKILREHLASLFLISEGGFDKSCRMPSVAATISCVCSESAVFSLSCLPLFEARRDASVSLEGRVG